MIKPYIKDKLRISIFANRDQMGYAAARALHSNLKLLLDQQQTVRIIFAAAPSQSDLLKYIREFTNIDWSRVTAFHMDEYLGISDESPQGFGNWLKSNLFAHLNFGAVHYLNPTPASVDEESERYADLINSAPIDIVCLGIGENGHIAFNDPPVADFNDPKTVKAVELEDTCRQQQVNDGCFRKLADVPAEALTLTVPALFNSKTLICVVPGKKKSLAVKQTIEGHVSVDCPASILRCHSDAHLFLDYDSAELLNPEELVG